MVDRNSRLRFADLLRSFLGGQITNDQYEDRVFELLSAQTDPEKDPCLWPIMNQSWFLHSDLHEHYLVGEYKLSREVRREVFRWILFLDSDHEYDWPCKKFMGVKGLLLEILTLGGWGRKRSQGFKSALNSAGDLRVWPFVCRTDYEAELNCPFQLTKSA